MSACPFPNAWVHMSAFSERLRLLRGSRQITQTRLSALLDVDPRVYNRWERGTSSPQFDTVVRIADLLQVSLDELAGRSATVTQPRIHNLELFNLYEQVDSLPDASQQALVLVIDGMVKQAQMEKVVGKLPAKR